MTMRQLSFLYIFVFTVSFSTYAQDSKKVLFIGNSYTAVNNLPLMVSEMAESTGDELLYDSNTPGGFRFMNHASNATTLDKIDSNDWDYVVLQAQSQETALSEAQMEAEVYPYAESLSDAIRANNSCSQPLFYMTWGRENGDASNCQYLPWVCTYEGMDDVIRATYIFMAEENEAEVAPAGAVWRYLRTNHPNIDLYASDGSHPSTAGSYAAGCAFYTMIYKQDPTQISWDSTLSQDDANTIRMAAKSVVFDSISDWDYTVNPAQADFTEDIENAEVTFIYTGGDFDSLLWDFGDSSTSTEINPIHNYEENGEYSVSLEVTKCGKTDVKTKTLQIDVDMGVKDFTSNNLSIYPNPVQNKFTIKFQKTYKNIALTIFDLSGKAVLQGSARNIITLNTDISALHSGIYFLKITAGNQTYSKRILKK